MIFVSKFAFRIKYLLVKFELNFKLYVLNLKFAMKSLVKEIILFEVFKMGYLNLIK